MLAAIALGRDANEIDEEIDETDDSTNSLT